MQLVTDMFQKVIYPVTPFAAPTPQGWFGMAGIPARISCVERVYPWNR